MVKHYNLTLDGTVQQLSDVLPANEGDSLKFITMQADAANVGVVYVGSTASAALAGRDLDSTDYGWRIEIPVSSVPAAPDIIELGQNALSLSELSVFGTSDDSIHILTVR